ncbi:MULTISPECIES: iron ABC transporter permease [unclassified Vibrio]|uniref:ABC transporter permease n=1 Tax=Vibrio sp. HB236076 TaxID=3232307 RepID=A0AB39HEX9_9VIBR|nr:iron ABC transporter permease [Vibrio sp. HB161653]MDP5254030.1 iron ABC transporter permease [Vibrio sp. HB161653]
MKRYYPFWLLASTVLAILTLAPITAIFSLSLSPSDGLFEHLQQTVLPTYIKNTFLLTSYVLLGSAILGVPTAWFMAMCQVPGERYLQWLLVLPLAMPGYIMGYIFTDWFDFAGPVQVLLRHWFDWQAGQYWFPDVRTLPGAAIVLSLGLYPYVYLLCRNAFKEQSNHLLKSAQLLRHGSIARFMLVSMPLARPSLVVALSLVAMETIGDFGTVSFFAVNTLTTAVYDTWLGYSDLNAAAKIAASMLGAIVILLALERFSRRKQRLFQAQNSVENIEKFALSTAKKIAVLCWCWGIVFLAFFAPFVQLFRYAYQYFAQSWSTSFSEFTANSLSVSAIAAVLAVGLSLIVTLNARLHARPSQYLQSRFSSLGYALPGTVLAIGVMSFLLMMDHQINDIAEFFHLDKPGLILSGTMFAIIFAFVVRFSTIAIGTIESHLAKISPSLDMAAQSMGYRSLAMLARVHFPLLKRPMLIAGLLVFIESMKELNAALLLRPFNFETLATYVYNFASDEQLELAALPAILLVLVGVVPLVLINRSLERSRT